MASINQWTEDWIDQFKTIFPTNFTTLSIHPGDVLSWLNRKPVAFGQKVVQKAFRRPDQRVQIQKELEYKDKYARRVVQTADMPILSDSLRIDEEYYAGDVVNAVGHVSDLFQNFNDALANYVFNGAAIDPLAYGLLDYPDGTAGTAVRPEQVAPVTTAGAWTTPANMFEDFASMDASLTDKGFHGTRVVLAPTRVKAYLSHVLTSTTSPYSYWISSIAGYPVVFGEWVDSDASKDAFDIYMLDKDKFDLFTTPLTVRGFFDNNTEDFVWHWKMRAYVLASPLHDGTEWLKGQVKCTVDWDAG